MRRERTTGGKKRRRGGCRVRALVLAVCYGVCWAGKCCHLSRQATDEWIFFLYLRAWSQDPPSLCITHTFTPLQPTAHLASMEYPLNISLCSLSTHHSSLVDIYIYKKVYIYIYIYFSSPFLWLVYPHASLWTVSQQRWLSRASVGMFFSCFHF